MSVPPSNDITSRLFLSGLSSGLSNAPLKLVKKKYFPSGEPIGQYSRAGVLIFGPRFFDFVQEHDSSGPMGYTEFIGKVGAIAMGATTYEWLLDHIRSTGENEWSAVELTTPKMRVAGPIVRNRN